MKTKHKFLSVLLALCMVFCIVPAAVLAADNVPNSVWTDYAAAEFAGGTGSETDPYQIATAEQLAKLSKDVNGGTNYQGKFFKLTESIDLSSHRWAPIGIWKTSGSVMNKSFQGFLDGNNKTISGLIVDESIDKNSAGFFGNIRNISGGTVGAKDLTISNANIYADEAGLNDLYAGILAGYVLANPGEQVVFENISVSGTVVIESTDGYNNVGGMIGYGDRIKATNCKAENISVTGASNSGGFIGLAGGCSFKNCKASGTVSGTWALGGFVGYSYSSSVNGSEISVYEKCAADVKIEGSDWRLGGFAGYAEHGKFNSCVALGDVASTVDGWEPKVGGFIGESEAVTATDCHAAGTVTSESSDYEAGGFVGYYTDGTFEGCSFDNEKNSGLAADGTGEISSGIESGNSNDVLANICKDYYGGHKYSTEWTVDTEATCTTDGSKSQHCERCDAKGNATLIPATEHKAETEWKHNETSHWNDCIYNCGEKLNKAVHSYEWVVDKEATATEAGSKHEECTVCGYRKAAVEIPATGTTAPTDPSKPTNPDKENPGTGTNSPQTGDNSNFMLWITLMGASAVGLGGFLLQKRRRSKVK